MASADSTWETPAATIELTVDGPELSWSDFVEAGNDLTAVLREVEGSITSSGQTQVRWVIAELSKQSPARVLLAGRPIREAVAPSTVEQVVTITARGLQVLETGATWPEGFTEGALEQAKRLADLLGERVSGIRVRNGSAPVTVTRQVSVNVDELIAPRLRSVGTLEGRLEGINIHAGQAYATIYDLLTGAPVRCFFRREMLQGITAAFGMRVAVLGEILSRPTGERASITISRIQPLDDRGLPGPDEVRGILQDEV